MDTQVPLVLLPGLDGTEVFFRPLIAALPPWIETSVVGYPSSGSSSYADLLPRVEAAVDQHPGCFVLAWSFGGPLALRIAAARPDVVRGVILCASFVRAPRPELVSWRFAAVAPVIGGIRAAWRTRLLFRRFASPEFRRAKAETWRRVGARALARRTREVLRVDARSDLARCRVPVLYLAFSRDRVVPPHNADEVLRGACDAELRTIAGHHLALFTNAQETAAAVESFVARTKAQRAAPGALNPVDGSTKLREQRAPRLQ